MDLNRAEKVTKRMSYQAKRLDNGFRIGI